ncbi:MAG: extensin family protein [Hyphomicrobiaceae bacterium]
MLWIGSIPCRLARAAVALVMLTIVPASSGEPPLPERNHLTILKPSLAGIVASGHAMPLPERRPGPAGSAPRRDQPKKSQASDTARQKAEEPPAWTPEELAAAKAECESLTKGLAVEMRYVASIQHGQCGTPQPVEVKSFGSGQKVTLVPPAVMNCRMVAMLTRWLDTSVQPRAKSILGKPVARLINASAYVCRNRYGAKDQKLSEHAKANALDISAFETTDGRRIAVEAHWGPTLAEIEAQAAAEAERRARAEAAAKTEKTSEAATSVPGVVVDGGETAWTAAEEPDASQTASPPKPKSSRKRKSSKSAAIPVGLGAVAKGEPLIAKGSAKDKSRRRGVLIARPPELQPKTPEGKFLHAVHADACESFGTVLGPEANDAHRDHLHLDLAPRRKTNFCQ